MVRGPRSAGRRRAHRPRTRRGPIPADERPLLIATRDGPLTRSRERWLLAWTRGPPEPSVGDDARGDATCRYEQIPLMRRAADWQRVARG